MAKNIEPNLKKIGDYLKLDDNTVFVIPEYQRAYSWESANCDKLWNDIITFSESDSKDRYFFGTIIINCDDNDKKLGLIDGQQRTTTFLLLLKALLIRINNALTEISNDEESSEIRRALENRRKELMEILCKADQDDILNFPNKDKDQELFGNIKLIDNQSINEQYKGDLTTILRAIDYNDAEKNVTKIPRKQKDNKYTNFFKNFKFFYDKASKENLTKLNTIAKTIIYKCEVIEIKSWQVEQAITMFNSLNSDGLPLCDSDIISAQLYASAKNLNIIDEYKGLWDELNSIINELSNKKIITIDSLLNQQMYIERTRNGDTVKNGSIDVTVPGVRRYYIELNKELINNPIDLCEKLLKLAKNWRKVSDYSCVQVLFKLSDNAKFYFASYLSRYKDDEITEELIKPVVESFIKLFIILELTDIGYSSRYFKTYLFKEEVRLINREVNENELKEDIRNHIIQNEAIWSKDTIKSLIMDYDKHILVFVNEYLFARNNSLTFELGDRCDVEHIMPYSGKTHVDIRNDAGMSSLEEFDEYVNKLGNKILLEEEINRSISNNWFRTKISTNIESKTGYINSKFPMAKALVNQFKGDEKPFWKKEDIIKATEEAANRIVDFIFE